MHHSSTEWRALFDDLYIGLDARCQVEHLLQDLEEARQHAAMRLQRLQTAYPLLGLGPYVLDEEEQRDPDGTTYVDAASGDTRCAACNEPEGLHLRGCVHAPA